jgi:hypothetical protein
MKYFLILFIPVLFSSIVNAQSYSKVNKCVIENGVLKTVVTDYDPATGNSYITVNGSQKSFDLVYPESGKDYAISTSWYASTNPITVNGKNYTKYGYPRILGTTDIKKWTMFNQVGVYVEAGLDIKDVEVIYIPTRRGCEFQPYQIVKETGNQKIYYDADWRATTADNAAYYRLITLDAAGKPVGLVRDFFITGEKQWQGYVSHFDPEDNANDISEGLCTWFHKNGKKAAEVTIVHDQYNGVYKSWTENGAKESEVEYKNGILNGSYKTWFPNGRPSFVGQYVNGQFNGKQIAYLEDGRISYQETYTLGKPVKPCYEFLEASGIVYNVCTDLFSKQKNVFTWKYSGAASAKHSMDEQKGLQLKSLTNAKAIAFFDFPADVKELESISTAFTVTLEDEDTEYGLVWNYVDSSNFNYFVMSNGGWWSAGSFKNGERYGLEHKGIVKMSRSEYWQKDGNPQTISVSRNPDGLELWLNDNPIYSIYSPSGSISFKQKGLGLICLSKSSVYFERFVATYRKK